MWGSKKETKQSEELVDTSAKSYDFSKPIPPPPGQSGARPQIQMPQQQQSMIPRHMDDNDKIVIQAQRGSRKKSVEQIDRGEMSIFAEKMASLVGPSFVIAFFTGGVYGLTMVPEQRQRRTTRLLVNTYLNNVGKTASRFANNTAAAVFLYIVTGKLINHIFLEEFDDFGITDRYKNSIYGGAAGALYKSTRGPRPMVLGAVMGATLGSTYAYVYKRNFFLGN